MEMNIHWSEFSKKELVKIFDYYKRKSNFTIAKKLTEGIYNATLKLKKQPEIGQLEAFLVKRKEGFRYLIYKRNYKIIYWINKKKNQIEIIDVFDTRQNPISIKRTIY